MTEELGEIKMQPDEMRTLLRAEPFQPLRVTLTDGTSHDIIYPRLNLVTDMVFVIGVPDQSSNGVLAEDEIWIHWKDITSVEKLEPTGAAT
jgi:hypothetical protein